MSHMEQTLPLQEAALPASTKSTPSTIEQVTVFLSGAQITRHATAGIIPGTSTLTFSGISPDIDTKSIQVQGEGSFTILSVTAQLNFLQEQEQREDVTNLQQQLDEFKEKITHEENMLLVFTEEATMLNKNQVIGGKQQGLKTADLKEAMDFQRARLTEIMDKQQTIKKSIEKLRKDQAKIVAQLRALQQIKKDPTTDIFVTVTSKTALTAKFTIRYVVQHAGWYPNYDIRVNNITEPLALQYKAQVYQQCGEAWNNVKLTLSTGNPNERSVKPTLQPWHLNLYNSEHELLQLRQRQADAGNHEIKGRVLDNNGQAIAGASIRVKGRTIGTVSDENGNFELQLPEGLQTLTVVYVGFRAQDVNASGNDFKTIYLQPNHVPVREEEPDFFSELADTAMPAAAPMASMVGGAMAKKSKELRKRTNDTLEVAEVFSTTTMNYEIALPYSIPNNGKPYAVDVKEMEVPAQYQYYAIPKLDKNAYLTAGITNWEELNLLEGEANLYFEGTYLGRTLLDLQTTKDTLYLSLGADKQVMVNRILQKEYSKKQFLGSNTTAERTWELQVKNNKTVPIHITLQDQLPISATKEIEITRVEHNGATETPHTGQLNWDLKIAPAAEQKTILKYNVKYPKDRLVNLD